MADHGDNYKRLEEGAEGYKKGSLGGDCGHHCGVVTVGKAHQIVRHCTCKECHG